MPTTMIDSEIIDLDELAHSSRLAVIELLTTCNLPTADLAALDLSHFLGYGVPSELKGVVGVEIYGEAGLLRSLAVAQQRAGKELGNN